MHQYGGKVIRLDAEPLDLAATAVILFEEVLKKSPAGAGRERLRTLREGQGERERDGVAIRQISREIGKEKSLCAIGHDFSDGLIRLFQPRHEGGLPPSTAGPRYQVDAKCSTNLKDFADFERWLTGLKFRNETTTQRQQDRQGRFGSAREISCVPLQHQPDQQPFATQRD